MPRPSPQTDRVVAVLAHLTECAEDGHGATLTEISERIGVGAPTCVHLLASLCASGVVFREPADRRYHLGPALVRPGRLAAHRYADMAKIRAVMEELTSATSLTCLSFVPDGDHARLEQCTPASVGAPIRVGDTVPLVPPLGALFVAWADGATIDAWLAKDPQMDRGRGRRFRAQLDRVRDDGFAIEARPPGGDDDRGLARLVDERRSPRRDGRLHRVLVDHGDGEHLLAAGDRGTVQVNAIGAPVFFAEATVRCSLTLIAPDGAMSAADVARTAHRARDAGRRATEAIGGRWPS